MQRRTSRPSLSQDDSNEVRPTKIRISYDQRREIKLKGLEANGHNFELNNNHIFVGQRIRRFVGKKGSEGCTLIYIYCSDNLTVLNRSKLL